MHETGVTAEAQTLPILIVDDEPSLRKIGKRIVERLGRPVLEASSGEEALEIARGCGGRISLVITDVVMPVMDGIRLGNLIAEEFPRIRVLFISGHEKVDLVRLRGMAESAFFLHKPFTPSALAATIEMIFGDGKPLEPTPDS